MTPRQLLVNTVVGQIDRWNSIHDIDDVLWSDTHISRQIKEATTKLECDPSVMEYVDRLASRSYKMLKNDIMAKLKTKSKIEQARRRCVFEQQVAYDRANGMVKWVESMTRYRYSVAPTTQKVDGKWIPSWELSAVVDEEEIRSMY